MGLDVFNWSGCDKNCHFVFEGWVHTISNDPMYLSLEWSILLDPGLPRDDEDGRNQGIPKPSYQSVDQPLARIREGCW
jgi:hypothetical protein